MTHSGAWKAGGARLEVLHLVHFPGDKKIRDCVHARLVMKLAAPPGKGEQKAQKAKQSAGVSAASPGKGE